MALLHYHSGRMMICVVVLPSWRCFVLYDGVALTHLMSGRIHRRGEEILYSRSPLSEPIFVVGLIMLIRVGEITQERRCIIILRSPLSEPDILYPRLNNLSYMSGRFTGEEM